MKLFLWLLQIVAEMLAPLGFPLLSPQENHHPSLLGQEHHHHQLPALPEILSRQLQVASHSQIHQPLQNPSSQRFSLVQHRPPPFSFQAVNTSALTKTTTASPFTFMANAAGPSNTPAASFTFGSNAAGTAASAVKGAFQFAGPNNETAGSRTPVGATSLFQFGASNAAAVTTATTQLSSQTFGLSSTPVSSSSQKVNPFAFNAGSIARGFSFAPAQPPGTTGSLQSTFSFGASAPKPEATFAGFAPAQPSASQQPPFMFAASSSNPTSTPTPDEPMEVDDNNSSGNLCAPPANPTGDAFGSIGPNSGGFTFGASSAPSAAGFNFGAAAQASAGPSTFTFGAGAGGAPTFGASTAPTDGAAPAPGGFNFSAAAVNNNSAGPGMFNFAGGTVTPSGGTLFTAGAPGDPTNPAIAQGKIKKAVRRTKR